MIMDALQLNALLNGVEDGEGNLVLDGKLLVDGDVRKVAQFCCGGCGPRDETEGVIFCDTMATTYGEFVCGSEKFLNVFPQWSDPNYVPDVDYEKCPDLKLAADALREMIDAAKVLMAAADRVVSVNREIDARREAEALAAPRVIPSWWSDQ